MSLIISHDACLNVEHLSISTALAIHLFDRLPRDEGGGHLVESNSITYKIATGGGGNTRPELKCNTMEVNYP